MSLWRDVIDLIDALRNELHMVRWYRRTYRRNQEREAFRSEWL